MKLFYGVFLGCLLSLSSFGQSSPQLFLGEDSPVNSVYDNITILSVSADVTCSGGFSNPALDVTCFAEDRNSSDPQDQGDNNAVNGAFIGWTGINGTSAWFSELRLVGDPDWDAVSVFGSNPTDFVFPLNDPNFNLSFGGSAINSCRPPGVYEIRIWDVQSTNGRNPDRDGNGDIIGCYVTCMVDFLPSCPPSSQVDITVDVTVAGCDSPGALSLSNFSDLNFYCTGNTGTGATIRWTGPNGFTSNDQDISNLEPGDYTVTIADIYGCEYTRTYTIEDFTVNMLSTVCTPFSPSVPASDDGFIEVEISGGTGNYSVSWTGPVSGSQSPVSDNYLIQDLVPGDYVITVVDLTSMCETMCTATVPPPSCLDIPITYQLILTTDASCEGATDGGYTIQITGGVPLNEGFFTELGGDHTTASFVGPIIDFSDLGAGTYTGTIYDSRRDELNCFAEYTVTIEEPEQMTFTGCMSTDESDVDLEDGSVTFRFSGGRPDYTATLYDGDGNIVAAYAAVDVDPDTDYTFDNLPPGDYEVYIVDENGCTVDAPCAFTVNEAILNCVIDATINITDPLDCFGDSDGGVEVVITMDVDPVVLTWSDGPSALAVRNDLSAGMYSVTVTEGPCQVVRSVTLTQPDSLGVSLTRTNDILCSADSTSLIATAAGGTGDLTYFWSDPTFGDTNRIDSVAAGTYFVTVTDENLCTATATLTITEPDALTLFCSATGETGLNEDDGRIGFSIAGGTLPYRLELTDPNGMVTTPSLPADDTLRNLIPGQYLLVITDANGCRNSCFSVVEEVPPCQFDLSCAATDATTFTGNGSVTLTTDGELSIRAEINGPVLRTITLTAAETIITDLPQGTYTVTASDSNDCTSTCTFTIGGPDCDLGASFSLTQPVCDGTATGSITLTATDGSGNYTYDWEDDSLDGQSTPTMLTAGVYRVTISDDTGCPNDIPLEITLTDPVSIGLSLSATDVDCNGAATGGLEATVTGAVGTVTYDWSVDSFPDAPTVSGVAAGLYQVTVTDENGCTNQAFFEVTEPDALVLTCSARAETLVSANDGRVGFTVSGGTPPYVIELNDMVMARPADDTFRMLSPGTYVLEIIDANDCTISCTSIVNRGGCGTVDVTLDVTQPDCDSATGSITANPVDPNGDVTYRWSTMAVTATIGNLPPGSYSVTMTDEADCEVVASATILPFTDFPTFTLADVEATCGTNCVTINFASSGPAPLTIGFSATDMDSNAGSGTFTVNGTTAEICPADAGLASLAGGTLTIVDATAGNGCVRGIDQSMDIPLLPEAIGSLDTALCPGAIFEIGSGMFTGGTTGTIRVNLPDQRSSAGCDTFVDVTLSVLPVLRGMASPQVCSGDSISIGGEFFSADRPTGEVSIPGAGSNGCDSIVDVNLVILQPQRATVAPTLCPVGSLTVGGTTFDAANPTGEVNLGRIAENGCDSIVTVNLSFYPEARATVDTTLCFGGSLTIGGTVFDAGNPTGSVTLSDASVNGCDSTIDVTVTVLERAESTLEVPVCLGDTVRVLDDVAVYAGANLPEIILSGMAVNGCDSFLTIVPQVLLPGIGSLTTEICEGESFSLGGVTFDAAATDVEVVLDNASANGCDSLITVNVTVRQAEGVELSGDGIICADGSLEQRLVYTGDGTAEVFLSSDPATPLRLSPGEQFVYVPAVAGQTVTILSATSDHPCGVIASGSIEVMMTDLAAEVVITSGDGIYAIACPGEDDGTATVVVTGGEAPYSFEWSNRTIDSIAAGLIAGEYSVVVTSARGCSVSASAVLTEPDSMIVRLTTQDPNCLQREPLLFLDTVYGGVGPYLYQLTGQPFLMVEELPDTLVGRVGRTDFLIQDVNGCEISQQFVFPPATDAELDLSVDRSVIRLGDSVRLTIASNLELAALLVTPGADTLVGPDGIFLKPETTTRYLVTALTVEGCTASDSLRVIVDPYNDVYVPNSFSPNEDGTNDFFRMFGRSSVSHFENFQIFSRWGAEVFRADGPLPANGPVNWGWDGRTADGQPNEVDVYVWSVEAVYDDGRRVPLKGDVMLMR